MRIAGFIACWLFFSFARASLAQPLSAPTKIAPLTLIWNVPEGCPSKAEILLQLELPPADPSTPTLIQAVVAITRVSAAHWKLSLDVIQEGELGTRTISGQSCKEVASAAALILALALAEKSSPPPPLAPSPPPRVIAPVKKKVATNAFFLGANVSLYRGGLPNTSIGLGISSYWRSGRWGVLAHGTRRLAREQKLAGFAGADFTADIAGALFCMEISSQNLISCGGLETGRLYGRAQIPETQRLASGKTAFWLAPKVRIQGFHQPFNLLKFNVFLEVATPLYRPGFEFSHDLFVFRPAPVTLETGLAMELAL